MLPGLPNMIRFIIRRLLVALPLLFASSILTFILVIVALVGLTCFLAGGVTVFEWLFG